MSRFVRLFASALTVLTLLVLSNSPAYGQGGTTSTLSGVAVDSSGGATDRRVDLWALGVVLYWAITGRAPSRPGPRRRRRRRCS